PPAQQALIDQISVGGRQQRGHRGETVLKNADNQYPPAQQALIDQISVGGRQQRGHRGETVLKNADNQ
ncbi:hypothetical protein C7E12_23565, partial [Stenotrophomonas maltophilia]